MSLDGYLQSSWLQSKSGLLKWAFCASFASLPQKPPDCDCIWEWLAMGNAAILELQVSFMKLTCNSRIYSILVHVQVTWMSSSGFGSLARLQREPASWVDLIHDIKRKLSWVLVLWIRNWGVNQEIPVWNLALILHITLSKLLSSASVYTCVCMYRVGYNCDLSHRIIVTITESVRSF